MNARRSAAFARVRLAMGDSFHFGKLPGATLDALASLATLKRYDKGELLHASGSPIEDFWFIIDGGIRVSGGAAGHRSPAIIAVAGRGSFYSISAFVKGAKPVTCATAERGTVAAVIKIDQLLSLQESDRAFASLVPELMLRRFQAAVSLYADVVSAPLTQRLARRLISHAMAGGTHGEVREQALHLSQSSLAVMLGASRSKINVELRSLERQQLIRLGYRRMFLLDFERLCKLAGSTVVAY